MHSLFHGLFASQISGHLFAPVSSYDALATIVVGSGGSAQVTFAGIPQTYTHLQIRGTIMGTTGAWFNSIFNSDVLSSDYSSHEMRGDGTSITSAKPGNATYGNFLGLGSAQPTSFITDILDYTSVNKYKTLKTFSGTDANGSGYVQLTSGLWMNTSAINSITLRWDQYTGGFPQNTQFSLYGIR